MRRGGGGGRGAAAGGAGGRGRGRGRGQGRNVPTKEELDAELDAYRVSDGSVFIQIIQRNFTDLCLFLCVRWTRNEEPADSI